MVQLRDYQETSVNEIRSALAKYRRVLFQLSTGGGKCLGADVGVLMYDGTIKKAKDVIVGDLLMGDDSTPRRVLSLARGRENMYRVIPVKGEPFECNESHILSLQRTAMTPNAPRAGSVVDISVRDYLQKNAAFKHIHKLYHVGVEFPEKETLIDPWILGLWLANNYHKEFLRCLNNGDHHDAGVPLDYKVNSRDKRLRLLAGLINGAGHLRNNSIEIVTKFNRLRDDILFLARSLGFMALCSDRVVNGVTCFRISISGDLSVIPNVLGRKHASVRRKKKDVLRTGFSLEPLGEGDYYGFEIDGNRRFLLGDFTVTHNTVCFSFIAHEACKKGRKVLVISPRTEILLQNGGSIERIGGSVEYVTPRHRTIPKGRIVCAMAQTLQRRVKQQEWLDWLQTVDMLIVDEAHLQVADFVYDLMPSNCFVLLLTATPRRSSQQRQLGSIAKAMVTGITTKELIAKGYLSPARHFGVVAPKLESVKIDYNKGDYNSVQLAKAFEDRTHYVGVVDEWERLAKDRKTIFFCCSSEQTIETTRELVYRGHKAKYVLSGSFEDDDVYSGKRNDVFDEFKRGEIQVLVNLGIAIAGLDVPDITCVVLDYATISLAKYLQSIGRGSRVAPGKRDFLILDAGENIQKHGLYDADRTWSLWHDVGCGTGEMLLKQCPVEKIDINHKKGCGEFVPNTCKVCPACGYVFPTEEHEFRLHLEEITESGESRSLVSWAAQKKLEGWKFQRIAVQVCLRNTDEPKKALAEVYLTLYPDKSAADFNRFWYVFKTYTWDKIRLKKEQQEQKERLWR